MSFADKYLQKHLFIEQQIQEPPSGLLRFVVVIPAYSEDKILDTLNSVKKAHLPQGHIEVIIIVNYAETEDEQVKKENEEIFKRILKWSKVNSSPQLKFFGILAADMPEKHAGAGLARKIGMDESVNRFNMLNRPQGLILSLDADASVEINYFKAIEDVMNKNDGPDGCILRFEHPVSGTDYPQEVYNAIIQYELHLRYYKQMLHYIGFPYARYTIGSCFGVTADAYIKHGGMNRRKAGEDFYFLNKVFPNAKFVDINSTCVHPSPRISNRVPFGTGPEIARMIGKPDGKYYTYSPQSFADLKLFIEKTEKFYRLKGAELKNEITGFSEPLKEFLTENEFNKKLNEISLNTASFESFGKRFFNWFDAFKIVKYLNYSHKSHYKKVIAEEAVKEYFMLKGILYDRFEPFDLLSKMRELEMV
ncbi:MAG: glycosyltransferase family 2 protein [Bacteroidales bacterium]|nr:glycosyltransferase family 2 protein [Bacteroidales bacterium]